MPRSRVRIEAEGPFGAIEPLEYVSVSMICVARVLSHLGISTQLQLSCAR
jgi:hypothetical protein